MIDAATNTDAADNNYVIFDVVQYSDLDETSFNNLIDAQMTTLAKALNYTDADALEEAYLADPTKFMNGFTDSDTVDGELVYFHYSLYDDNSYAPFDADRTDGDDPYSSYDPTSYENTVSYLKYSFEDSGRTYYYDTYVNYAASEVSVSSSSDSGDTTDEDTTATPDYNIWLLISSILLAAALIITLLALLLRKLLSGMKRKGDTKKAPAYSNRREMYIRKLRQEETEREDEPEENEEDLFTDAELYNETEQPEGEESDAPEENGADDGEPSEQKDGGSSMTAKTNNAETCPQVKTTSKLVVCTDPKRFNAGAPVNGYRNLATHHYSLAAAMSRLSFLPYLFLIPVNGSMYSLMLIWSRIRSSSNCFFMYSWITRSLRPTVST